MGQTNKQTNRQTNRQRFSGPSSTEIINPKGKNSVIGVIYRHYTSNPIEFIDLYLHLVNIRHLHWDKDCTSGSTVVNFL